ncbi:hypothetical protein HOD05_05340 [Candidatus Woesearchaeota archaeon]|jgi:hypothetical protein|nr:hypothetical protein [Candidatus Woesearchaeota archaeon]MBT4150525.1 hypothetical protein [Candidatus Woesearchaeota archaeon]MBT4247166.1 hypothetical protein [Candidatus Woesearchaeota archaeon]MBT4434609.1 hypothetical protein [Candidatus Woesearchaeota archaeon]MBT7332540.1 hypothetical protein [Candidatus Woesearchaeota archaeon]
MGDDRWWKKYLKNGVVGIFVPVFLMIVSWSVSNYTSISYLFTIFLQILLFLSILIFPKWGLYLNIRNKDYGLGFWTNLIWILSIWIFIIVVFFLSYHAQTIGAGL